MADEAVRPGGVQDLVIEDEMRDSYLTYAMSVIVSRALPDVRDGLKPSQRRILVAMNDLELGPRSKHKKCAKIAGDTSGNYHPHGESVIYPTLVRLAQDFNMRERLIDGQGNFGSIDGDPPAAMRYTEARMTFASTDLMEDIDQETVDTVPNYDESRQEPTVLPAKFPNLLINGSSGIAVGMATNIPPHNAGEICDAVIAMIDKPGVTVDELMEFVKGPDFPTGGSIEGGDALRNAYHSGRGIVQVEGKVSIETHPKTNKVQIVVTEIPYQLSKAKLIETIVENVKEERITGISDVRDESDRDGIRLVIEVKKGDNENVVLNQIYKFSPLRDSFGINMIALVKNRPEQLSLRDLVHYYIQHRFEVIRRRTKFQLRKAEERKHIVEGLVKAISVIDAIIALIKKSSGVEMARQGLMDTFEFSERQANAILEMRLQRLTALEVDKLQNELAELIQRIARFHAILEQDGEVYAVIRADTLSLKARFPSPRRTEVMAQKFKAFTTEDIIEDEQTVVTITHRGYIKRTSLTSYRKQGRGGMGVAGAKTNDDDFVADLFIAQTHDYLCLFTNLGKIHWLKVYELPDLARNAKGRSLANLIQLAANESISSVVPVRHFDERNLIMATRNGVVKKSALSAYGRPQRGGIRAIRLDAGDELIGVAITTGLYEIMLATRNGFAIRFPERQARRMGRVSRGVRGIKLRDGDAVVDMIIVNPEYSVLTACENGYGKRTLFDEYRLQSRGGKGIINIKATERNGKVVGMKCVNDNDDLMLITSEGMIVRIAVKGISVIGRATQGVRLIQRKTETDKLIAIARIAKEEDEGGNLRAAEQDTPQQTAQGADEEPGADDDAEPDADAPEGDMDEADGGDVGA